MDNFLRDARINKNDEFYTLFSDIEKEIEKYLDYNPDLFRGKTVLCPCNDPLDSSFTIFFAQNFTKLGLKKLITTSYNTNGNDAEVHTLEPIQNSRVDIKNISTKKLKGDGDFRSHEVKNFRDESDFIITNPPFSLFREFISWIIEAKKKFIVIGNINCIAYKEIFPLLKDNRAWLGTGLGRWISGFVVPEWYPLHGTEASISPDGKKIVSTNSCLWLTNVTHSKRHEPLSLMTMEDNLRYSKHKEIRSGGYKEYDNYNAIDVPFTDSIPSDYDGIMGVPLTFLDKYCPDQFTIIGSAMGWTHSVMSKEWKESVGYKEDIISNSGTRGYGIVEGKQKYHRILITHKLI